MGKKEKIDFINKENRKQISKIFTEVLNIGLDFKLSKHKNPVVVNYKDQDKIIQQILEPIPKNSKSLRRVIKECEQKIIDGAVNF